MATVVTGSVFPPDNSGNWYDDGWGGWTNEASVIGIVPNGFFDDGWGNLTPTEANATLDSDTIKSVQKAKEEAKGFKNTAVGRTLDQILLYGNSFIDVLIKGGILKNPFAPISYDNIDQEGLAKAQKEGKLSQNRSVFVPNNTPTTSTFFGIDFSKPLNIILLILGFIGLWKLISPTTAPAPAK